MGPQEKTTPKNYQVRVSVNAIQNIEEITGYIAFVNQQPLNAVKVGDALFATIDRISRNPLAFKECEELPTKAKMYRRATCFSWLIIYRIMAKQIVILGVIHSSRRPSRIKSLRKIK
jgi:plasmid stabilization system protein ParE